MTTIQKTLIAATLVVAGGVGMYEAHEVSRLRHVVQILAQQQTLPVAQAANPASNESSAIATRTVTNVVIKPFDWRKVESEDYRKYIANLRSTGCPEETIRDIITADVGKLFNSRRAGIVSKGKKWEYWHENPEEVGPDPATLDQLQELNQEKHALLKELLGVEPQPSDHFADNMNNMLDTFFSFLPADKRSVVADMMEKSTYETNTNAQNNAGGLQDKAKQHDEKKKRIEAELAKILSPEELEDWQVRASDTAAGLRGRLAKFQPSEQEFRHLFKLQQAFEEQWGKSKLVDVKSANSADPAKLAEYNNAGSNSSQISAKLSAKPATPII